MYPIIHGTFLKDSHVAAGCPTEGAFIIIIISCLGKVHCNAFDWLVKRGILQWTGQRWCALPHYRYIYMIC